MRRDAKMDVQIGVSKEGYAGRLDVIAGPTGRQLRKLIKYKSAGTRCRFTRQQFKRENRVPGKHGGS